MTPENSRARRAAFCALLASYCLLAIGVGSGDSPALAAIAGLSGAVYFLFSLPSVSRALEGFAPALSIVAEQALLLGAMTSTGGLRSPAAVLLPAGAALAWHLEGRESALFQALAAAAGAGGLVALGLFSSQASGMLATVAIPLAAPAVLLVLRVSRRDDPRGAAAVPSALSEGSAAPASAGAAPPGAHPASAADGARPPEEAILHDLRSPLSVMRVYVDLISEGARRGELPNPEHLVNLSREIELALRLVESPEGSGTAGSSDSGAGAAPTADLVDILGSLATAYRLSLAGRRRIEFIAEKPQLPVAADPVALQRAFRNVLENAIKYTEDGGEVRIRAGPAGPHAFVVVKDTGIGMSADERARAFDYAFRGAGAVASGTTGKGIGLAVTKQILEANGGRISLSSEAGYGSEVTILLPFVRGNR